MANPLPPPLPLPLLWDAAHTYPLIDNHAHPLLKASHRAHPSLPFEGVISEAQGDALTRDAGYTLAAMRAAKQLGRVYGLGEGVGVGEGVGEGVGVGVGVGWEDVKRARDGIDYDMLCKRCMDGTGIQCLLLDDGLGGVDTLAEDYKWHDQFTHSPTLRIVRIEVVAETLLETILHPHLPTSTSPPTPTLDVVPILTKFTSLFSQTLTSHLLDPCVVALKSIVCYRTGLDISTTAVDISTTGLDISTTGLDISTTGLDISTCTGSDSSTWSSPTGLESTVTWRAVEMSLLEALKMYRETGKVRLAFKALNDHVVRVAVGLAGGVGKPVQFHTGLGDNDITLVSASPSWLQPIIKAYPKTPIILLHSSYPFTREAGYLTAVYENVFLDFGEIFPFVSAQGQRSIIQQVLELCPTNKIMWSSDGHWWPETFYLGAIQARQAMYDVLSQIVHSGDLTEAEAVTIVQNAFFHNANRVYGLGLVPKVRGVGEGEGDGET